MPKYVIVGASAAGIGAVEAIREVDPVGTYSYSDEEHCPQYSRPMISDFVSGKADWHKMKCRDDSFWQKNNVEALTGKKAVTLNIAEKTVQLEDGEKISYEKLLLSNRRQTLRAKNGRPRKRRRIHIHHHPRRRTTSRKKSTAINAKVCSGYRRQA